jgi:hypothetical protein
MHNIYVTLSQLHFLDELVILRDISIKDILKPIFFKKSSEMIKPFSNQKKSIQMVSKPTKIMKFLWIQILTLKHVIIIYYMTIYFTFAILSDSKNNFNGYNNIDYWIEDL